MYHLNPSYVTSFNIIKFEKSRGKDIFLCKLKRKSQYLDGNTEIYDTARKYSSICIKYHLLQTANIKGSTNTLLLKITNAKIIFKTSLTCILP